jgi:hypothetical protein
MHIKTSSALHAGALALARRGLAVFPCQPRGKEPACQNGFKDGTTDVARINAWWSAYPDLNIAIATGAPSGIFVVDVDDDKDGEASLCALEAEHGALPPTVEAITGNGRHLYFRVGDHGSIACSAGAIGKGIDTRGAGGYVIVPPSVHPSGRRYAWSVDSAAEFADAPEWIYKRVGDSEPRQGKPLEHWHCELTRRIHNGERNSALTSLCGKLLHIGVKDVIILLDLISCVNEARCEAPLDQSEVESIVASVVRSHLRKLHADE